MFIEKTRQEDFCQIKSDFQGKLSVQNLDEDLFFSEVINRKCPLKSPLVVHLELTKRCQLKCGHCYISATQRKAQNELSVREWKDILIQLKELEVMSVYFTGGDPFLNDDCIELLWYANSLGISCNLLTNGLKLNNKELISSLPEELFLVLSYDGQRGTKILRGIKGQYILEVIRLLQEAKKAFALQGMIIHENVQEIGDVINWCLEENIDFTPIDFLPLGNGKSHPELYLREDDIPQLLNLEKIYCNYRKSFQPSYPAQAIANPNMYEGIAWLVEKSFRPEPGLFVAYVGSDGTVYPDNYYAGEKMFGDFNLRETTFAEGWKKSFLQLRDLIMSSFTGCNDCTIKRLGGFCDLQSIALSQSSYKKEHFCGAYPMLRKIKELRLTQ